MKRSPILILVLLLGLIGFAIAQNEKPEETPEVVPSKPAFTPSETIRPDQDVAFPVDI
jgi:hypothetical protein